MLGYIRECRIWNLLVNRSTYYHLEVVATVLTQKTQKGLDGLPYRGPFSQEFEARHSAFRSRCLIWRTYEYCKILRLLELVNNFQCLTICKTIRDIRRVIEGDLHTTVP